MAQEICLLCSLAPKLDGERQGMYCLLVTANEGPAEVYPLEVMLLGLEIGDLADVVAVARINGGILAMTVALPDGVEQATRDVFGLEHPPIADQTTARTFVHVHSVLSELRSRLVAIA